MNTENIEDKPTKELVRLSMSHYETLANSLCDDSDTEMLSELCTIERDLETRERFSDMCGKVVEAITLATDIGNKHFVNKNALCGQLVQIFKEYNIAFDGIDFIDKCYGKQK